MQIKNKWQFGHKRCVDCNIQIWDKATRCKSCDTIYRHKCGVLPKKKLFNLSGKKFGYLTVIKATKSIGGRYYWICSCICGRFTKVRTGDLNSGSTQSCGCKQWKKGKEHHLWISGNTPKAQRNRELKYLYGISLKEYHKMSENQNNKCAICKQKETRKSNNGKIRVLSVDHNHITGKVRKLLCSRCNAVLGLIKENKFILNQMVKYITKHE
jgi:hypothetical protein